jgi:hypothetical protein
VLIVSGAATVTPTDKSCGPIALAAGDAVHFHKGFRCAWHVTAPMTKRYGYFGADGKEAVPAQVRGAGGAWGLRLRPCCYCCCCYCHRCCCSRRRRRRRRRRRLRGCCCCAFAVIPITS